jgi:hypothetical protein
VELLLVDTPILYFPAVVLSLVHTAPPKAEVDAACTKLVKYPPVVVNPPKADTFKIKE